MTYRPPGWKNPYQDMGTTEYVCAFGLYEAGADAMLKALFEMAKNSPTGMFTIDGHSINVYRLEPNVT